MHQTNCQGNMLLSCECHRMHWKAVELMQRCISTQTSLWDGDTFGHNEIPFAYSKVDYRERESYFGWDKTSL